MCKKYSYIKTNGALANAVFLSTYFYYYYFLTYQRNLTCIGLWQIVYDVTVIESFNKAKKWLEKTDIYASDTVCKLLVGNNSDLDEKDEKKVVKTKIAEVYFFNTSNLIQIWCYLLFN